MSSEYRFDRNPKTATMDKAAVTEGSSHQRKGRNPNMGRPNPSRLRRPRPERSRALHTGSIHRVVVCAGGYVILTGRSDPDCDRCRFSWLRWKCSCTEC